MFKSFLIIICCAVLNGCLVQENRATVTTIPSNKYLVNINTASVAEMDELLDGVGPVTSNKIKESRKIKPFSSIYDLRERNIIGKDLFKRIKGDITVGTTINERSGHISNTEQ